MAASAFGPSSSLVFYVPPRLTLPAALSLLDSPVLFGQCKYLYVSALNMTYTLYGLGVHYDRPREAGLA